MIEQRDLFHQPPAQRHSATSVAAAESMLGKTEAPRERVFACIREHGPITDERIAELTGMNANTSRPRRIELVDMGLVKAGGISRRTRSGRKATAWVAV